MGLSVPSFQHASGATIANVYVTFLPGQGPGYAPFAPPGGVTINKQRVVGAVTSTPAIIQATGRAVVYASASARDQMLPVLTALPETQVTLSSFADDAFGALYTALKATLPGAVDA